MTKVRPAKNANQATAPARARSPFPASPSTGHLPRPRLRCAVYTRKSSEEGLEQSFNSLHAQRDACEAFVASQKHEGWVLLPTAYDDGGLSGGSMERPALRRLLDGVRGGLVDIIVVYKVDRLTRSLADFAKLTELFDAHGASFVSVTQAFNTSTSMGRLTLNVLLSFAQFEREVAGERIRDKIALSKRRGMWMGGLPPLGYDGLDRKLVVNEAEASSVRLIFQEYLACGSIAELKARLDQAGVVSKRRCFADGRESGGVPFSRGAVYQILRNRLYRGEIAFRGEIHPGEHPAIIDEALWQAVQDRLAGQSGRERGVANRQTGRALLADLAFDATGERLTPTYARKAGREYRYYVSASLTRGLRPASAIRVPAGDLEALVVRAVCERLTTPEWTREHLGRDTQIGGVRQLIDAGAELARRIALEGCGSSCEPILRSVLSRVDVRGRSVAVSLDRRALREALVEVGGLDGGHQPVDGYEPDGVAADLDDPLAIEVPRRRFAAASRCAWCSARCRAGARCLIPNSSTPSPAAAAG